MQTVLAIHTAIIGFMVFFLVVVAQTTFKTLSEKAAGAFLRVLFPRMFIFGGALSISAAIISAINNLPTALWVSFAMCIGFGINAFILTPTINHYRDAALTGHQNAKALFRNFHFLSVLIFLTQLAASGYIVFIFLF